MAIERIQEFTAALQQGKAVAFNEKGKWEVEGLFIRFVHFVQWLVGLKDRRLTRVAHVFNKTLEELERVPVKFNAGSAVTEEQTQNFKLHIDAVQAVLEEIKKRKLSTKRSDYQVSHLAHRVVALKYRIEAENGGLDALAHYDQELFKKLEKLASDWKDSEPLFNKEGLQEFGRNKIKTVCRYPEFAKLLLTDSRLRVEFFKRAIRDGSGVDQFVQFPAVQERIRSCLMAGRVGRFGPDTLRLSKEGDVAKQKELSLRFGESERRVCVLDESQEIVFKNDWKVKIKEVFDSFKNKNYDVGNFEFFNGVIRNWHVQNLAAYNPEGNTYDPVLIDHDNLWSYLPVFETITKEELEKRYQLGPIQEGHSVAFSNSTRQRATLDIDESHGYLVLARPNREGKYNIYAFGKFASEFPESEYDKVNFIAATMKSRVSYVDENAFYSHRQKASVPFELTQEQDAALTKLIVRDINRGLNGNLVFQFGAENCAYWPQALLEELLGKEADGGACPNIYPIKAIKTEPSNPAVNFIIKRIIGRSPEFLQNWLWNVLEFCLSGKKGHTVIENGKKVHKSITESEFHKTRVVYLPAHAHKKIKQGTLKGSLSMGHRVMLGG